MGPALGKLVSNIEAAGYRVDQIDDVILTHIHADHSGGLVANGKRVFENATLHVNHREAEFWLKADVEAKTDKVLGRQIAQAEQCVGPYVEAKRFETFADNAAPLPGFGSVLRAVIHPATAASSWKARADDPVLGDITHGDALQYDHPK